MKQPTDNGQRSAKERYERRLGRRAFVKLGILAAAAISSPAAAFAAGKRGSAMEKSLAFYSTHTGEKLKTVYWADGHYLAPSLREINYILRDPRNDEIRDIDTQLLDLLFALCGAIDARQSFHIISGYRSPATNAFLRAHSSGVAKNSLHLVGQAIDIRCPGRDLRVVQKAAMALQRGGVGYYPKSDFVHVDTGRVRYW